MNDNFKLLIFSIVLIFVGIGMIISIKDEVHILAPLAGLGACAMILVGVIFLIVSLIHLI